MFSFCVVHLARLPPIVSAGGALTERGAFPLFCRILLWPRSHQLQFLFSAPNQCGPVDSLHPTVEIHDRVQEGKKGKREGGGRERSSSITQLQGSRGLTGIKRSYRLGLGLYDWVQSRSKCRIRRRSIRRRKIRREDVGGIRAPLARVNLRVFPAACEQAHALKGHGPKWKFQLGIAHEIIYRQCTLTGGQSNVSTRQLPEKTINNHLCRSLPIISNQLEATEKDKRQRQRQRQRNRINGKPCCPPPFTHLF